MTQTAATSNVCPPGGALTSIEGWNGWGADLVNSRYQPAKERGPDGRPTFRTLNWRGRSACRIR